MRVMLRVDSMETFYGPCQSLFGMSLEIREGEAVALLGRNGMGKTTTVRSIIGLTPARSGTIEFGGCSLRGLPTHRIARMGIALVPEQRQVFPNLTVRENLVATAANRLRHPNPWTLSMIYRLFPILADRQAHLGNQLSGGEQQMLAIGRALMTKDRKSVV